jgi:hypothetical protein
LEQDLAELFEGEIRYARDAFEGPHDCPRSQTMVFALQSGYDLLIGLAQPCVHA